MQNLTNQEWFRSLALALVIIGVGFVIFAAVSFLTTQYQIGQNLAYQVQQQAPIESMTESEGMMLMRADIDLRRLQADLNRNIIIFGGGLVCLAVGWMGRLISREKTTSA